MASPPRRQEHMYKWSGSQRTPAGHQQRTSDTRKDKKELRGTREYKERQKRKAAGQDLHPWGGGLVTGGEISRDRKGASEAQRRTQQPVRDRQDRVRTRRTVCATALHTPA